MTSQKAHGLPISETRRSALLARLRSDPSLSVGQLADEEGISPATLRAELGIAPPPRHRHRALVWSPEKKTFVYAPHIAQWGTARWLGLNRDRARRVNMSHLPLLQSLVSGRTNTTVAASTAAAHISTAMAALMAPSREAAVHAALAAGLIQAPPVRWTPELPRDLQTVLLCMAAGLTLRETASVLTFTVRSVGHTRTALRQTLGAESDVQVVGLGWAARLLHAESRLLPIPEMRSPAFQLALAPEPEPAPAARMVTAHALISRATDGAVLMVRSARKSDRRLFRLPAVALHRGETPPRAAERALLEETGLRATAGRQLLQEWVPATEGGATDVLALIYDCGTAASTGLPHNAQEDEGGGGEATHRWVTLNDLRRHCHPHQARRVDAALEARFNGTHVEMHRSGSIRSDRR
ncbi:NUDIX domain-containing protein [Streptomyces chattanoogensis]|uniref:NUDIX domain-containing protein n=1 Tax=Streptomyces chattanoogensis TaxID=66876 RepID=UPI003694E3E0